MQIDYQKKGKDIMNANPSHIQNTSSPEIEQALLLLIEDEGNNNDQDHLSLQSKVVGAVAGSLFFTGIFYENLSVGNCLPAIFVSEGVAVGTRLFGSYVNTLVDKKIGNDVAHYTGLVTKVIAIASLLVPANAHDDSFRELSLNLLRLSGAGLICEEIINKSQQVKSILDDMEEIEMPML